MSSTTRAFQAAIAEQWAITAEWLEIVLAIANRDNVVTPEALEAYRAKHVPTAERLRRRGNVSILDVTGPLFRHANLFTEVSGATSYDIVRRDLQVALDDQATTAIVMSFDTPGGVVNGVNELAEAIFEGRQKKPIIAYVGGYAASAGYWLASQATEIVVEKTATLGSIGVRAVVQDTSKRDAEQGRIEFVSSQSPGKRADLASDEGRARVQRQVDALADVFIATVARGRGVKPEDVVARFGGGDVLIGEAAVAAGMADRIGTFEAVIAELAAGKASAPKTKIRRSAMADETVFTQADLDAATAKARDEGRAEGARAERERIGAILALDEAKGREASARHLALNTDLSAEAAKGVLAGLAVSPAASAPVIGPRAEDAPGGLVTMDPSAKAPTAQSASDELWKKTIGSLNQGSGIAN
jgi:Periplasmic serine proteases (ClpP class)